MEGRQGMALGMVMVIVLAVSVLGVALLSASSMNSVETSRYLNSVKAFWLADAGVQRYKGRASAVVPNFTGFTDNTVDGGVIQVTVLSLTSNLVESVGTVQGVEQKIQFKFGILPKIYETAIYAANKSQMPWTFMLRGTTNRISRFSGTRYYQVGGQDIVMGNIFAGGDVKLYERSVVSNAPAPNTYGLLGDVRATGTISNYNSAIIRGGAYPNSPTNLIPNFRDANYPVNNTWDVAREFQIHGADSNGRLPTGHALRDVVKMNPRGSLDDRSDECDSTVGDDYFFEPNAFTLGVSTNALTPLNLGARQVYYVDGHAWFNSGDTYGFRISGTATIAASRDIHVSDNLKYATANDLLGLVAVGRYDSSGVLETGGNFYFGDPNYGTLYTADAFMLAANNFYYNTSATDPGFQKEPDTGFTVYGNYAAMNQVNVYRDWYTNAVVVTNPTTGRLSTNYSARSAWFDPSTNRWRDVVNTNVLSPAVTNTIRHYQMIVKYDERIRNQSTQPPGLPGLQSGTNGIYQKIFDWKLYPY
jgi:hypothetical protein